MVNPSALDQMVCFQLYAASRAMTGIYRPILEPHGLTYPQLLVLVALWDNGPTTVRDLGQHLHLDSGTLSPLLKRLETAGHVTRTRGSADERTVLVTLTDTGHALRDTLSDIPTRIACAVDLTETEFRQLIDLLSRVRGATH
ncbi:MarR family transcriptional regulator [Paractinoplanes abujensis]|uniref:DNA-binding MarR family transcriptional regulator n=1 Tax=Paractinoplanes abujensis TaxID=882441 RepID=A0A7W7CP00_9ACTN|nr:MarR family transcriptional regulator [Actinoplanes abujensis]MBB4691789.1 DNA-binding MarR family transcriptional regulator [Actinoplanes abujensis]GID16789.1 MarR family transcriptional regulator [Actinoplanes abujensis]